MLNKHIELTAGNVLAIGFLSLLFYGGATWGSKYLATRNIPFVSPLATGAQSYLHGA
jgi:hypothetical protein